MTHSLKNRWPLVATTLMALAATPVGAKQPVPEGAWQTIVPDASVLGVDGNTYAPSCTGFPGTDPTFKFWAKKSATGSRKTMVYFEGGGACWDSVTCSFPIGTGLPNQFFVPQVPPGTNPATMDGAFKNVPANPVKDWNVVYIPYCSGDIHTGSSTQQYFNVGFPQFPAGTPFTLKHRGFDNFMSVLAWMKASGDKPQQILVTGSSAGGYGATANFPWIADTFKSARVSLLADASQGVTTTAFDTGLPGRNSWNPQLPPWVFGPAPSAVSGGDLIRVLAGAYPQSKIAQFTTPLDGVQIAFYGYMKQAYGPGGSCPNPVADWNQLMLGDLQRYEAGSPNYRHYVAAGSYHTIMRTPLFFTEASAGPTFAGWLGNMLKNQGGTGGKGGKWDSVACPTCLAPLPCF
jgi:Pectinacetylesterase